MAELPPSSSQDSLYDRHRITLNQENVDSSPLKRRSTSILTSPKKQKTAPTITPRRFKKFFTPRTSLSSKGCRQSKSGRQLRDITKNGVNRQPKYKSLFSDNPFNNKDDDDFPFLRSPKRRKVSLDIASSPPISSPIKGGTYTYAHTPTRLSCFEDVLVSPTVSEVSLPTLFEEHQYPPKPVQRLCQRRAGPSRRILERSFGERGVTRRLPDHAGNLLTETASFVTMPRDVHDFRSVALPFCTTACNTNSLVAVGDEEGTVRLVDSSSQSDFNSIHVNFRTHHNAVMDIAFNSDDYLLATASGDQSSRIIDMPTQKVVSILTGHMGTVKQVRFSPVDDRMVYTSSKDGTVQIWDLRCLTRSSVAQISNASARLAERDERLEPVTRYAQTVLEAYQAHQLASRPLVDPSRPELSITAIHHMPHGREHLLLTASEVNASIKLWDLRNAGRRNASPLSSTVVPDSHTRSRNYGINSLVMSKDGGRLYAACRDSTVYAYSTTQLALGCVPEMSTPPGRRRMRKEPHVGAAPLYGFRHSSLRLDTFYIKASLRPCQGDQGELLALGSSEKCPILFSTDERHFARRERPADAEYAERDDTELPMIPPMSSQQCVEDTHSSIPIYQHGTALVRGHNREVTSVAWTHGGNLVSISDDFSARCWREDAEKARHFRTCGESGGERWSSGWAEVDPVWDQEEI